MNFRVYVFSMLFFVYNPLKIRFGRFIPILPTFMRVSLFLLFPEPSLLIFFNHPFLTLPLP